MRTKIIISIALVISLVVLTASLDQPRVKLAKCLAWKNIPSSVEIKEYRFFKWEKDPRYYWHIQHSPDNISELLRDGYSTRDPVEVKAAQRELMGIFGPGPIPPLFDQAFYNETNGHHIVILTGTARTESYICVYSN
jgi:hypothetical protein